MVDSLTSMFMFCPIDRSLDTQCTNIRVSWEVAESGSLLGISGYTQLPKGDSYGSYGVIFKDHFGLFHPLPQRFMIHERH